jgi:hypothetical protein
VTTGLDALDHDGIHARAGGGARFRHGAHLRDHLRATCVCFGHVRRGIPPKEHQDRHALLETRRDLVTLDRREHEVDAEGTVGQGAHAPDRIANGGGGERQHSEHSEPARVRHRGDEIHARDAAAHSRGENRVRDAEATAE